MIRTTTTMMLLLMIAAAARTASADENGSEGQLEEIIVTAGLRTEAAIDVPTSVSVLDSATLQQAGQQQFQDVIALVPNLNWAGDTSRPRYFQIRGIGELEQYQGAPNPSVGFLIDDIDFSGLGTAATLYDIDQIEVLRGPQGTRYGANALGGLIYVRSHEPTPYYEAGADVSYAAYNTLSYGAYVSGPVESLDSSFRLAAQKYTSDGFYHNLYLNRFDTNRRDELTLRGRWRFQPSSDLRVDLSVLHVQLDNGYDAYAIDNTRNTRSDDPSVDSQHSTGAGLRLEYTGWSGLTLTGIGTYADSRVKYGFDGDWGNPVLWAQPQFGDVVYRFTDLQHRNRDTQSVEFRLASSAEQDLAWLVGVYALQLHENFTDTSLGVYQYVPTDPGTASYTDTVVTSGYRARNEALFGELDGKFWNRWRWSAGVRLERRTTRYSDVTSNPGLPDVGNVFGPADTLWGGSASLSYGLAEGQSLYLSAQRGYKASGFNLSQGLLPGQVEFHPEWDVNVETGYKADLLDRRLRLDADVFYTARRNLQLKTSEQSDPTNPNSFVFYTENVDRGYNYGFEGNLEWIIARPLTLGVSLGLLQTRFQGLVQNGAVLPDRALANAPPWQAAVNLTYHHDSGAFARVDVTGMGAYYFDLPPNPTSSSSYELINLKVGFERPQWAVYVWARNLANRNYPVRGFFFGDEPPDFPNKLYTQLGDPRVIGANALIRLGSRR